MTTVLHTDDEHRYKIVQLSLDAGNRYSSDVTMTIARISQASVTLARLKETVVRDEITGIPEDPEKIALSEEEMDALMDAWMTFKAEQLARTVAEEERKAHLYAEAFKLAATVLTSVDGLCITIDADDNDGYYVDYYHVKVSALRYHRHCHVDRLVSNVQELIDQTERYIDSLEYAHRGYHEPFSDETKADAKLIAAWRAVRPLPVEPEQGVTPEDITVATSMSEQVL